jgi:hypothetical protein
MARGWRAAESAVVTGGVREDLKFGIKESVTEGAIRGVKESGTEAGFFGWPLGKRGPRLGAKGSLAESPAKGHGRGLGK